jgi:hypothetical protein
MKSTTVAVLLFIFISLAWVGEFVFNPSLAHSSPLSQNKETVVANPAPARSASPDGQTFLDCREDTPEHFNNSGIEVLPFLRAVFFDVDNDGIPEMIAGSKDGSLRLYKNSGTRDNPRWRLVENYFDGIQAGAFSSPAVGDINHDGKLEVLIGTGGFSSDSGKVICYRNAGSLTHPMWKKIKMPQIMVGNDATPTLVDIDHKGRPDLIVGNSAGNLFFFRNQTKGKKVYFREDPGYFRGVNVGIYAVPAVTVKKRKAIIIVGNGAGKLYILERSGRRKRPWRKSVLPFSVSSFAAPAFIQTRDPAIDDMVVSDGNGGLQYFKNKNNHYREWEQISDVFDGSIPIGPACAPAVTEIGDKMFMVAGNINGELKLFEYLPSFKGLPWAEKRGFFNKLKLPGFSKGVLTLWQGVYLLITGQQDGVLRAFLNSGTREKPTWVEQKEFFRSLPLLKHAAPTVFDIDGDGKWELIVGDEEGHVYGFRYEIASDGIPEWKRIEDSFRFVKVDRFAVPAIFKDSGKLYLLSGQQDGKIQVFKADMKASAHTVFYREGYLHGIQVNTYSSPSVISHHGLLEISVGDYDGNLKHFTCKQDFVKVKLD